MFLVLSFKTGGGKKKGRKKKKLFLENPKISFFFSPFQNFKKPKIFPHDFDEPKIAEILLNDKEDLIIKMSAGCSGKFEKKSLN
ncbi:MAG: hypothetical protein Ct9H300mP21_02750 [Pseudomonadota bacterium]|nr:MAG: hypothetical protein Ct9H300mP21_02750 [Pseudomonadota bacterium]